MADLPANKLIEAYLLLRDRRSELKKAFDAQDTALKAKQESIENYLLGQMEVVGTDQLKAGDVGIAFRSVVTKVSCSDWVNFWPVMAQIGRFDFMEKRLSSKAISEYLAEPGHLELPGINTFNEYKINVRKA